MEQKIINLCFINRAAYDELIKYIVDDDFVGPSQILWQAMKEFYEQDADATKCDGDIVLSRIQRSYPKQVENLSQVIKRFDYSLSVPNLVKEIIEFKKHKTSLSLSSCLLSGNDTDVKELIDEWLELSQGSLKEEEGSEGIEVYSGISITDIVEPMTAENLIRLYPKGLNRRLDGGVPKQFSVALYARPEVGKSLFGINMAAGNCRDGWKTLYIGNEDPAKTMLLRMISRFSGMGAFDILKDPHKAEDLAFSQGYGNLVFASLSPGTILEIEGLIRTHSPDAVYVDQTRNIHIPKTDGLVQVLEKAAGRIRNLGKKYNALTVQITQAGDSATNKLVLEVNDVDNSKTGFQAAFDVMIGIGANAEYDSSSRRMMSLTKNKRPSHNHEYFPVGIDKTTSSVRTI